MADFVNWIEVVDNQPGLSTDPRRLHGGLNSGYQAINLVYHWGVSKIVLAGYDMQKTNGELHHHGKHDGSLPNLGTLNEWVARMVPLCADLRARGIKVINASRQTAITCLERMPIEAALTED